MKFCNKCVMPDTRPGIEFINGTCTACINYEKKKNIDWDKRWNELERLCEKFRGCNGDGYDCAIAVSGGKDSHFQIHVIKELLKMNPLLISVSNFSWTQTGLKNFTNISDSFGCDIISLSPNMKVFRIISRLALEKLGSPMWYVDAAIYAFPYKMAMQMGLNLLFYGENVNYEYGGSQKEEISSALKQFENDVVKPIDIDEWCVEGLTRKDLNAAVFPSYDEITSSGLEPVYLSYFVPWDTHHNYLVATKHGFSHMDHEWKREGTLEQYNQIDNPGYLINQWFKYPKFGHSSATEMASRWIRAGLIRIYTDGKKKRPDS